jgi:uncharacterized protein YybS (DUF2232 family)
MKTCLLYGFIWALAGIFLGLALYFLGYHSDPAKFATGQAVSSGVGLIIAVAVLILGIKARRDEVPASEPFGYGRALGAGTLISLVAVVLNSIFSYVYFTVINPGFVELMVQNKLDKLQSSGMSSDQMEKTEAGMRMMMSPAMLTVFSVIFGFIFAFIICLVVAAFLKRPDPKLSPA